MRFRREIELARHAYAADFDVSAFAASYRHRFVGQVRDARQHLAERFIRRFLFGFQDGNPFADGPHLLLAFGGVLTRLAKFSDLYGLGVAAGFQLFRFGDGGAAALVELAVTIEIRRIAAGLQPLGNTIEVRAKPGKIVHLTMLTGRRAGRLSAGRTKTLGSEVPGLFVVLFNCYGFEVFGFEDLAAIQAFQVFHAIAPGDDLGTRVIASELLHK